MEDKLRKIQLCELEILKEIARICDKNDIKYYLAAGTMLGAVRHQGFIPWDDDADVYMTMEDFRKFEKCCKTELGSDYFLQTPRSEPLSGPLFFKVRKNGTYMPEGERLEKPRIKNNGIWVDIFPLINCADDEEDKKKQIQYCQRLQAVRWAIDPLSEASWKGKIIISLRNMRYRIEEKILWSKVFRLADKNSKYYFVVSNIFIEGMEHAIDRDTLDKRIFENRAKYRFENEDFYSMLDYDSYLIKMYGQTYMIPRKYQQHVNNLDNVIV